MYKYKEKLIHPIIFTDNTSYGKDNCLYRSLRNLFETFYIYTKPHRQLYLVGGCVRDLLLGKQPKDYDLCTDATPDEVKQICDAMHLKYFDSGIKHGTLTIIDDFYEQQYEITTYRVDGKYSDGRHPDEVSFTPSLEEDLKRRDFTINSFVYDLLNEEVSMLDKSYLFDLRLGIIRTVGNPEERFKEDALRMLRAIRFSAQLGFSIETKTFEAIKNCSSLIKNVSHERIRDELTKILLSNNPQMLEFVCVNDLEKYIFNGNTPITDMLNCEHQNPWHYTDVFHHTIDVVKRLPRTFELRWSALLHDIGKPRVKKLKEGTTDHYRYIGHPIESAMIADEIMDTLKFSNEQKDYIRNVVLYHDYPLSQCSMKKFKKIYVSINDITKGRFDEFLKLREADALAHKLSKSTEFAINSIQIVKERYYQILLEPTPLRIKDLKINGNDLLELGFKGPSIGKVLNILLDKVLETPQMNTKENLINYVKSKLDTYKYLKEEGVWE